MTPEQLTLPHPKTQESQGSAVAPPVTTKELAPETAAAENLPDPRRAELSTRPSKELHQPGLRSTEAEPGDA
jgi:hypothetical protein